MINKYWNILEYFSSTVSHLFYFLAGPRGSLQVHRGSLQDRADQGGRAHLPREQLLRTWARQELSQGKYRNDINCVRLLAILKIRRLFVFPSFMTYFICQEKCITIMIKIRQIANMEKKTSKIVASFMVNIYINKV